MPLGNLIATVVLLVLSSALTEEAFLSWGWRIGFWLSVVIVAIGYYVRTRVTDAHLPRGAEGGRASKEVRYGVLEVIKRYPRGVLTAMGLRFAENIMYYLVVTFSITYLGRRSRWTSPRSSGSSSSPNRAHDRHPAHRRARRPDRTKAGVPHRHVGAAAWSFVAFPMFDTRNPVIIVAAICLGLFIHAFMYAPQPAIMSEMFPTRMRYSGVSLGYQVTSIVAGSLAPIIATALLASNGSYVPVAVYLAIAAAITLIAVISLRETKGASLHELDRLDEEKLAAERVTTYACRRVLGVRNAPPHRGGAFTVG